jgi:hypothetical protein
VARFSWQPLFLSTAVGLDFRRFTSRNKAERGDGLQSRLAKYESSKDKPMHGAVLDDYQSVALKIADWSLFRNRAEVTVFNDHLADEDALAERLAPFGIVCVMRERTALTRGLIGRLPKS